MKKPLVHRHLRVFGGGCDGLLGDLTSDEIPAAGGHQRPVRQSGRRILVHKAGLEPAELRFLAEDVSRLHHLCIWCAGRDSNPQDPVPETEMSSFASPAHMGIPGRTGEGTAVCRTGYETPVRTMIASNVVPKTAANTTKLSKVGIAAPRCHL